MKKTFSSKKSAFSLIELSIVLIIIGLLIAGITGGASLIKSSELRSAMGEARGYAVAVNGFYSQYSYLPGDYATAVGGAIAPSTSTAAYTGSSSSAQNGRIEFNTASVATYLSESVAAWDQLIKSGTIDNISLTLAAPTTQQTPGTHMPSSKVKSAGWHFDYRINVGTTSNTDYSTAVAAVYEGVAATSAYQNVVVLTGKTTAASSTDTDAIKNTLVNGSNLAAAILTGPDAMSIDTKIDDSYANAGKVRGLSAGTDTGCYTASDSANVSYTVSSTTDKVCALTFQVDVNS
jgi:prepilin-type N-terminal cleavage/methylation domain-containing protein